MSRCFPYPPPGYYRNGASHDALIESIKLQKETNKTKADRKKDKKAKKEKKEKRLKQKTKNEFQIKETLTSTELLEKSDLTQEHGQPISPNQPSYSSDNTQNSNKRKRDDYALLPDSSTCSGGSFKIRFLKKQKGSDSSSFVSDVRSNPHSSVSSFNSERSLVSCNGKNGVPATYGIENRSQTLLKSNPFSDGTTISDTNRLHIVQSARPSFQTTRPQHEMPSSSLRTIDQRLYLGRQQQPTTSYNAMSIPALNGTNTSAAAKRPINEIPLPANGGLTKQKEEPQKVGPTRSEKKMLKKHAKYEKLIGSWLPPVLQSNLPDDDWLSSSKISSSSVAKSEVKGEGETCRELAASWQPCSRFLAEVDIHALPYTVPF